MSMMMLTVIQIVQALAAYSFVMLFLSWVFLRKYLAHFELPERIIGYFLTGNLYYLSCLFVTVSSHFQFDYFVDWNTVSIFCPSMEKKEVCSCKISSRIFFPLFSAYLKRRNWSKNADFDKLSQVV